MIKSSSLIQMAGWSWNELFSTMKITQLTFHLKDTMILMEIHIPWLPFASFKIRAIKFQLILIVLRESLPISQEHCGWILIDYPQMMGSGFTKQPTGTNTRNLFITSPYRTKTTTKEECNFYMTNHSSFRETKYLRIKELNNLNQITTKEKDGPSFLDWRR